jgi:hypothetical protein
VAVVAYLKVLLRKSLEETEENHEKLGTTCPSRIAKAFNQQLGSSMNYSETIKRTLHCEEGIQ